MEGSHWVPAIVLVLMMESAEAADGCFAGGDIAGAVLGTFFATLLMVAIAYYFYTFHWKKRRDKDPVLVGDPENVKDEFAFDNPGFKTMEGQAGAGLPRPGGGWPRLNVSNEKSVDGRTFLDDTYPESNRGSKMVPLWSKDFTGLGFEISGSMRDGIYVNRVLRGGPAYECGQIHTGDRINSVRISFRNMVYEDALNILSFASPYELQLEVQAPLNNSKNSKDMQSRLSAILSGNANIQRSPGSTLQIGDKSKKNPGYDSLDKNWKSGGVEIRHPILGIKRPRCNSNGDVSTLEKSTRQHHFTSTPSSANSTLDASNQSKNTTLKKMLTDKMINSSTLEKSKPYVSAKNTSFTDKENEKNMKNKSPEHDVISKPERTKVKPINDVHNNGVKNMAPPDVVIIKDGGDMYSVKNEKAEVQKKEADPTKKGMKFGIRVLPPNIPDDGTINMKSPKYENLKFGNENGNVVAEIRSIDEVDKKVDVSVKTITPELSPAKTVPVVAKRREKPIAPIPNVRTSSQITLIAATVPTIDRDSKLPENIDEFHRNSDLNSSGIKRDSQGIPQEIPQHMMEAAMFARSNRKSHDVSDKHINDNSSGQLDGSNFENMSKSEREAQAIRNAKKSKGKAPSPPELSKSGDEFSAKDDESAKNINEIKNNIMNDRMIKKDMNFTDNFAEDYSIHHNAPDGSSESEQKHMIQQTNRSDDMILKNALLNASTPKVEKVVKRMRPEPPIQKMNTSLLNDSIDNTLNESRQFNKNFSDSLNNYFDDSKSNDDSAQFSPNDSLVSNLKEKLQESSMTMELNSTDVIIHSSSNTESEDQDDNGRKASSLGDLSKLETDKNNSGKIVSQGTLERAQSLDITSEEAAKDKHITAKKRKSNSIYDGDYFNDINNGLPIDSDENVNHILIHSKEPRLSLDIGSVSPNDGLNTFQKNRLKKASEWGNLEDAIELKRDGLGSSNSGSSEITDSRENINTSINNISEYAKEDEKMNISIEDDSKSRITNDVPKSISNGDLKVMDIASVTVFDNYKTEKQPSENLQKNKIIVESTPEKITSTKEKIKPEPPVRSKIGIDTSEKPNFEIGTYAPDPMIRYTENVKISSGKISPKLEEKLTMIYDTNIPDDIKVSRHSLVSSLERPKSDLMKKLLAQNPTLTSDIETTLPKQQSNTEVSVDRDANLNYKSVNVINPDVCNDRSFDIKSNSTVTMVNQPDIVNLRIKPNLVNDSSINTTKQPEDFVSNINIVGATSKHEVSPEKSEHETNFVTNNEIVSSRNFFTTNDNIVTISTDGSQPSSIITIEGDSVIQNVVENFRNSIEINADHPINSDENVNSNEQNEKGLYNEILSELQKSNNAFVETNSTVHSVLSSTKTYLMEYDINENANGPNSINIDSKPVILTNETTTVNVTEDSDGHKFITQTTETQSVTINRTPVEIDFDKYNIETPKTTKPRVEMIMDKPDHHIIEDKAVMKREFSQGSPEIVENNDKLNNKDSYLNSYNTSENMISVKNDFNGVINGSQKGIDDMPVIAMRQTTFKFIDQNDIDASVGNVVRQENNEKTNRDDGTPPKESKDEGMKNIMKSINYKIEFNDDPPPKDYVTEIQVSSSSPDKSINRYNRSLSNIGTGTLIDDFLSNERSFSSTERMDSEKFVRRKSDTSELKQSLSFDSAHDEDQKNKRHSDFDLPRNTHIKFRTATYEPQNPPPNRLSLEKRLSQIEILKSNFEKGFADASLSLSPKSSVLAKPSNIPIKLPEKPTSPQKMPTISPSKIPVFNNQNQKSASQENLLDKNIGSQKATQNNKLSSSSGNISITSIKSSSRNPSGK